MKTKKLTVMTSFGPISFENIMDMILKELTHAVSNVEEPEKIVEAPQDVNYYITKIANKINKSYSKTMEFLESVYDVSPAAAFSMILREIAVELDYKYPDHIRNSKELYCISMVDGRIHKMNPATIKNFRNFSAFRTMEDAKLACRILKPSLKELFSERK